MNPHAPFNFHIGSAPALPAMPAPAQSSHPGPATSPSQSVPGRRTPLGAVGIGGFYAQGGLISAGSSHTHTDENQPGGSRERLVKSVVFILSTISLTYSPDEYFI